MSRIGNVVTFAAASVTRSSVGVGYNRVYDIPLGFRPVTAAYFRTLVGSAFGFAAGAEVTVSGASLNESFSAAWITRDDWPTVLP